MVLELVSDADAIGYSNCCWTTDHMFGCMYSTNTGMQILRYTSEKVLLHVNSLCTCPSSAVCCRRENGIGVPDVPMSAMKCEFGSLRLGYLFIYNITAAAPLRVNSLRIK
jgi:hypothetical protein